LKELPPAPPPTSQIPEMLCAIIKNRMIIVILNILKILYAFLFAIAAWYELRSRCSSELEKAELRIKYNNRWKKLIESKQYNMPRLLLQWTLNKIEKFEEYSNEFLLSREWLIAIIFIAMPIIGFFSISNKYNIHYGIIAAILSSLIILLAVLVHIRKTNVNIKIYMIIAWINFMAWYFIAITTLEIILSLKLILSIPLLIIATPIISIGIAIIFYSDDIRKIDSSTSSHFVFISLSLLATYSALLIGKLCEPLSDIPVNPFFFISNSIGDSLTVLATYIIINKIINIKKYRYIPLLILLDLVIAFILSTYVLFSSSIVADYTFYDMRYTLIGRSIDNTEWYFGPYFWAIYTTFIPTIIYLTIIYSAYLLKLIYVPIISFLSKGKFADNPVHFTAGAFAFLGAIVLAVTKIVELFS